MPERTPSGRLERVWRKRFRRGPMDPVDRTAVKPGWGIVGNTDTGGSRQITVMSRERWATVVEALGIPVDPSARRVNLLVSGVDLENCRGQVLRVGPCRILMKGETRPCERMDEAEPGLRAALEPHWGGGAYGEVLDEAEIAVGDTVRWERDYCRASALAAKTKSLSVRPSIL